ncbi:hypothetical protein XELAEV_18029709mg [Xenopus laevis]|uniref:Reverse transcriptase domain-containing protein n=1 Tax=Xenopus laevis TaxID=8355 RepID=A0A974CTZ8_XENLA|nr:hypothetical protein XELAEV_18029709mg [Xenopus laevis]
MGIPVDDGQYLVSLDVEGLYSSIPRVWGESIDGVVQTEAYRKPTSTISLLWAERMQPQYQMKGVPVAEFLRMRRNCSTDMDFKKWVCDLEMRFKERKDPRKRIRREFKKAKITRREVALYGRKESQCKEGIVKLITPYHNQWYQFIKIVKKHWGILYTDENLQDWIKMELR